MTDKTRRPSRWTIFALAAQVGLSGLIAFPAVAQPTTAPATRAAGQTFESTDGALRVTAPPMWSHPGAPPQIAVFLLRGPVLEGMSGPAGFIMRVTPAGDDAPPLLDVARAQIADLSLDPDTIDIVPATVDGADAYRFAVELDATPRGPEKAMYIVTRRDGRTYVGQYRSGAKDFDPAQAERMIDSLTWIDAPAEPTQDEQ